MTAGDFIQDSEFDSSPSYPTVFGLTLTPPLSGILLGVLGLAAFGAMIVYLVMPAWETNQQLDTKVKEKSEQLQQQGAIRKQIQDAKDKLTQANQQRDQVYALFASEKTLDTLLFDVNQLIERNNAGLLAARNAKLNSCPVYVRRLFNLPGGPEEFKDKFGELVAQARLKKFKPSQGGTQVINDGSLGAAIDNKLKRQTIEVEFRGNFNQTQSIFRTIERLQPLLLVHGLEVKVAENKVSEGLYEIQRNGTIRYLTDCQPDIQITTAFKMDALLPLSEEERKAIPTPSPSPAPGK
jgi:type IV pilus assembly protein PilO